MHAIIQTSSHVTRTNVFVVASLSLFFTIFRCHSSTLSVCCFFKNYFRVGFFSMRTNKMWQIIIIVLTRIGQRGTKAKIGPGKKKFLSIRFKSHT